MSRVVWCSICGDVIEHDVKEGEDLDNPVYEYGLCSKCRADVVQQKDTCLPNT